MWCFADGTQPVIDPVTSAQSVPCHAVDETVVRIIKSEFCNPRLVAPPDQSGLVREILNEAWETAVQVRSGLATTLRGIALAQARMGELQRAQQLAEEIPKEDQQKAYMLQQIASARTRLGDFKGAAASLTRALEAAEGIVEVYPKATTIAEIAVAMAAIGEASSAESAFARALKVARAMRKTDLTLFERVHGRRWPPAAALTFVATSQARAGNETIALQIARTLYDDRMRATAMADIAEAVAQRGNFQSSLEVANLIEISGHRSYALLQIVQAQVAQGNTENAMQTSRTIMDKGAKASALISIARRLDREGNREESAIILRQAHDTVRRVRDRVRRIIGLQNLALTLATLGDRSGAAQALLEALRITREHIVRKGQRTSILTSIAEHQAQVGDIEGALKTAEALEGKRNVVKVMGEIAETQTRIGDHAGAARTLEQAHLLVKTLVGSDQDDALHELAEHLADGGDISGALRTARGIELDWRQCAALEHIAQAQVKKGDVSEVLIWARQLGEPEKKARVLLRIAETVLKSAA